ncbi:hypothetical protein CDAR_122211 [Caerostris darwini]|uniref:Uncharacterized protein n=1 Tax=Caerostris darwini TaxID=1538125 RepID=A0AAV4PVZ4_9ARAC|nr:hypothetical protein CDAR_122211 [Caerostris darwini]
MQRIPKVVSLRIDLNLKASTPPDNQIKEVVLKRSSVRMVPFRCHFKYHESRKPTALQYACRQSLSIRIGNQVKHVDKICRRRILVLPENASPL